MSSGHLVRIDFGSKMLQRGVVCLSVHNNQQSRKYKNQNHNQRSTLNTTQWFVGKKNILNLSRYLCQEKSFKLDTYVLFNIEIKESAIAAKTMEIKLRLITASAYTGTGLIWVESADRSGTKLLPIGNLFLIQQRAGFPILTSGNIWKIPKACFKDENWKSQARDWNAAAAAAANR